MPIDPQRLIRLPADFESAPKPADEGIVSKCVNMVDGVGGRSAAIERFVSRYAQGIKRDEDAAGNELQTYVRADREKAIREGFYEIVLVNLGRLIIEQRATLYSEPSQSWTFVRGGTEDEAVADLWRDLYNAGSADLALIRADKLADACGSAVLHVVSRGNKLAWQPIPISKVLPVFAGGIVADGNERTTDVLNIEEASAVVITTGGSGNHKEFVAYMGASLEYPSGRHLMWVGSDPRQLPAVGAARDWTRNGWSENPTLDDVANPLTAWAQDQGLAGPEYPLSVFYGDSSRWGEELLPATGADLYEDSVECDVAASLLFKNGLIASRGIIEINTAMGGALPAALEGIVHTRKGQTLKVHSISAEAVGKAWDTLRNYMRARSEARGVPGHLVVADDSTDQQSGVALAIRNEPLRRTRRERWRVNRGSIERMWDVSRAVYNAAQWSPIIPADVDLVYDPGDYEMPGEDDRAGDVARMVTEIEQGFIDLADAVVELENLGSREEAIAYLEQRAADKEANEVLKGKEPEPPAQQPMGLFARR